MLSWCSLLPATVSIAGYAYLEAECQEKSVSIVSDEEDFYASKLIAHEIGHRYC
ncbi:hypothetical protein DPMN_068405 [Dreissena polymorpha]|uniref:Uncharacterized protein n=1 Tax=Dreissena polymorpha TaxID=45954 RepID=A0A9D4BU93_DREPO|nr:hypothetical protein DPMN_068405 [Dreissena polymorpha]